MKPVANCESCRKRKLKCDRAHPCGPCRTSGIDCAYGRAAESRRAKLGTPDERSPAKRSSFSDSVQEPSPSAPVTALLSRDEIARFADVYFTEQERRTTSYAMSRQAFNNAIRNDVEIKDYSLKAFVYAVCGIGLLFSPKPDTNRANRLFSASQAALQSSDIDKNPKLIHIRTLYLYVAGLGPLRGPYQLGHLYRAVHIAHVLELHLEPDASMSETEKMDRLDLFATLVKGDWFSANSAGMTFTFIRPDAEALPSLFSKTNNVYINTPWQTIMQMADLSRRTVERRQKHEEKWVAITESILEDVDAVERASKEIAQTNSFLMQAMFSYMRWTLTKPFFVQSKQYVERKRCWHEMCVESSIRNLNVMARLFGQFEATSGDAPPPVSVVGLWFHIYTCLRCAIFARRFVSLVDDEEPHFTSERAREQRDRAVDAIETVQRSFVVLTRWSVIARDGLTNLQEQGPVPKKKRKVETGQAGVTKRMSNSSDLIDQLTVFDTSDGQDFWDLVAWVEPSPG